MRFIKSLCLLMVLLCGTTAAQATDKVEISTAVGGRVTIDNLNPASGDVVTITVTPDTGYEIAKSDITVEATIDADYAHAPRQVESAPQVGMFIELSGDDPANLRQERTYTFTMPEEPLNVLITVKFNLAVITGVNDIGTTDPKPMRYYNLQGRYVGTSLDNAPTGIYITGDGRKVIK